MTRVTKKYRKIPKPNVTAARLSYENKDEVAYWCGGHVTETGKGSDPTDVNVKLTVPNVSGVQYASIGDFVVLNDQNRFVVCGGKAFLDVYEEATNTRDLRSNVDIQMDK